MNAECVLDSSLVGGCVLICAGQRSSDLAFPVHRTFFTRIRASSCVQDAAPKSSDYESGALGAALEDLSAGLHFSVLCHSFARTCS